MRLKSRLQARSPPARPARRRLYRGDGGVVLVEACIARARLNEAEVVGLYTTEMMATARDLYARLGFVDDGPLPPRHGQPCRRYRIDLTSPSTCHIL